MYKIKKNKLNEVLEKWAESSLLFVPDDNGRLIKYNRQNDINWEIVPVWGGIKEFVFPSRNIVAGGVMSAADGKSAARGEEIQSVILIGIRNCDLKASCILDKLFLETDPVDTVYKNLRDNIVLVSVDCNKPAETCFCVSTGGAPHSSSGYDLNLSFLGGDVLIETGSEKGKKIIDNLSGMSDVDNAGENDIKKRDDLRETIYQKVQQSFNLDYEKDEFGEKIKENNGMSAAVYKDLWKKFSENCMQCGGCNFCCPTCYCNVLNELSEDNILKVIQWDSCHFPGYARVAGGANPRDQLWQRFRHRYLCKFKLMLEEFGMPGCTGCGRCIKTCPGEIDIRETLKNLKMQNEK